MAERAFLDANVPMYATGREHPSRESSRAIMRAIVERPEACWTSAEVLQELYHLSIRRRETARGATAIRTLSTLLGVRVAALEARDLLWCLNSQFPDNLQARDRVHLAVMNRLSITNIISADVAFDGIDGIRRLAPEQFASWREQVFPA